MSIKLQINIDVPELETAVRFYTGAFGLHLKRRLGPDILELGGAGVPVYLLATTAGSPPFAGALAGRSWQRHWTPLHVDVEVPKLEEALARVLAQGGHQEGDVGDFAWGRMARLSDPFGHGWCLIEFHGRGYDELAEP